jgi:hypothetical protein
LYKNVAKNRSINIKINFRYGVTSNLVKKVVIIDITATINISIILQSLSLLNLDNILIKIILSIIENKRITKILDFSKLTPLF